MSVRERLGEGGAGAAYPHGLELREVSGTEAVSSAWLSIGDAFDPPFLERYGDPEGYLEKMARNGRTVVCFEGGEIRGCVTFYANDLESRVAFLTLIAVSPACRGRGVAKALLETAIRLSAESGMDELDLEVEKGNRPALGLYGRFGFAVREDRGDGWILRKSLAPAGSEASDRRARGLKAVSERRGTV